MIMPYMAAGFLSIEGVSMPLELLPCNCIVHNNTGKDPYFRISFSSNLGFKIKL